MTAPAFGSWPSPITPELLVAGAVGISEVVTDGDDVYWAENRPGEGGRVAVVRWRDGEAEEVTGPEMNARTRVHEYGGGAWWVDGGVLVFSDEAAGGELHRLDTTTGETTRLTSEGHRYADGRLSADGAWYVAVRERHEEDGVLNDVVAVRTDGSGEVRVLASGHDFYSSPRLSPDGSRLVCVAWDHPDMPWDATRLLCGPFADGEWSPRPVPGPGVEESVVLPEWSRDGRLLAVTDRSDWWNLVAVDPETGDRDELLTGPFEIATPGWVFGLARHVDTPAGIVAVLGTPAGDRIRFPEGHEEDRHTAVTSIRALADGRVAYAASSFAEESAVWVHDGVSAQRISEPRDLGLGPAWFPAPELVTFDVATADPDAAPGTAAHALFYEPANATVRSEPGGRPPLIVLVHGGPTGAARRTLNLAIRFWTSRGIAVADVDYRGSTLYGREYRRALRGGWGVVDVADCVAAARHLADAGRVDPDRMVISGSSAGGLTVLNALAHHDVFAGGMCRYGVTDLAALATDTHKFEARYLDGLVGVWPDDAEIYAARSPIDHAHRIRRPLLVLQGLDDKVVPPSQSESIVAALESNGVPVTYLTFAGEAHGFRRAETITAVVEAEAAFVASL